MTDDERESFEERAAIRQYDAGQLRSWAEHNAYQEYLEKKNEIRLHL